MKKVLTILLVIISIQTVFSQDRDPRDDQFNYAPGKLIVKLKDHVDAKVQYSAKGVGTTVQVNLPFFKYQR